METLLEEMGRRLRERRWQLRLTQEEVAELAGVNSQLISTAETGKKALRPENILKLCAVLEISTDYLLRGDVTQADLGLLGKKLSALSPVHYRLLEDIVNAFLAALKTK